MDSDPDAREDRGGTTPENIPDCSIIAGRTFRARLLVGYLDGQRLSALRCEATDDNGNEKYRCGQDDAMANYL
jgi:hypothetical protein